MITKTNKELFEANERVLLDTFLNYSFIKAGETPFYISHVHSMLELIVTPQCNQKCDYCYITKYGDQLYPAEIRADKETTLKNIDNLMKMIFFEKKYLFQQYEIFAGDLFGTGYFFDLMDILYPYFAWAADKAPELFTMGHRGERVIIIPCNLRFIADDEITNKVIEYYDKFRDIGVTIAFSWSHDGKYSTDVREKVEFSDEYYEKAFKFIKRTGAGIHPMLSTEGIDVAKENFDWWVEMFEKYLPERVEAGDYIPISLEVRNDGWTDEKIEKFLDLLKYRFEWMLNHCENDIDKLARYYFHAPGEKRIFDYDQFDCLTHGKQEGCTTCSLSRSLTIRCSDLAIVPCHRTTYYQFIGGWFESDENGITGLKPNNVGQFIDLRTHNINMGPECCTCWNNHNCLHGCLGSQYEWSGELYLPIPSVCRLEKAKTAFCLKLVTETGVLKSAFEQKILKPEVEERLIMLCQRLGYSYD